MNYRLHPEAQDDLREAAEFYREKAGPALSKSLLLEFEHAVGLSFDHPGLGAIWRYDKRRLVMRRFRYALIYTVVRDQIRILARAHRSRRPVIGEVASSVVTQAPNCSWRGPSGTGVLHQPSSWTAAHNYVRCPPQ